MLKIGGLFVSLITILASFPLFRNMFHSVPSPVEISDVIPQLEIQYDRFVNGKSPYSQIILPHSRPFPVYMPFHWLPVSISRFLNIDTRWSGLILLLPAIALYGWWVVNSKLSVFKNILIACLPSVVLIAYIFWGDNDLAVSLETIIGAYYLMLAIGLLEEKYYYCLHWLDSLFFIKIYANILVSSFFDFPV